MINKQTFLSSQLIKKIVGEIKNDHLNIVTDSRKSDDGDVFLALKGEKFDGLEFITNALENGAHGIVCDGNSNSESLVSNLQKKYPNVFFVLVKDSMTFLQEISHLHALWWKKETGGRIICITGSNGKTTTKDMLVHFLSNLKPNKVASTSGNLNNHIGVPFSLLSINKDHEVAVIEIGTNHPGEISFLCDLATPTDGIITNIGPSHLEFFGNEENVFLEKRCLFDYVSTHSKDFTFIINGEDSKLVILKIGQKNKNLIVFGPNGPDIQVDYQSNEANLKVFGSQVSLSNGEILGKHNFQNLVSAFLMAVHLYPENVLELCQFAKSFVPKKNRSSWVEKNNKKYFLDAYNANPGSMEAGLKSFSLFCKESKIDPQTCIFILGDMNELGPKSEEYHQSIGLLLKKLGAINPIFVGRFGASYLKGFDGEAKCFKNVESLIENWAFEEKRGTYFFIKGSRSIALERLLNS